MPPLELDGLTKYYGDVRGVEDLSFTVESGEVFGFLGPNGAGKTTTIRTLMGFQSPTAGTARVLGADITDAGALRRARANVGFLPSEPSFDDRVTGRRILEYHAGLRGDVRSDELLELFDPPLDRDVGEYSRGNRQMLAIVIAFMHDPELVIMDEPTTGLDPLKQEQFHRFVRDERDRGKTLFFSSHMLSEVRKVCDRVGIVRDGRLAALEDVEALLERSGKTVRVHAASPLAPEDVTLADAHDIEVTEAAAEADDGASTVSFTYTGAYDPLLDWLGRFDLRDLTIEEAPLEAVFMRFYDDGPDDGATVRGPTGAGAGESDDDRERDDHGDGPDRDDHGDEPEHGERPAESTDA
ncbi:ABC transporter ATP-binding protein [Halobaculum roseum]|uniref:ABC transporter ATP-binding protein n=1 Tax=Halobaculum roseum TaxID=2175149 RepID=A0ABD5MPN8_9EURY|nr:ABC transporter ATP-binding protein [Halobaculum roseum]QZY01421.1 ABC transporter ATP-binding protein [Halobaculum roseum]